LSDICERLFGPRALQPMSPAPVPDLCFVVSVAVRRDNQEIKTRRRPLIAARSFRRSRRYPEADSAGASAGRRRIRRAPSPRHKDSSRQPEIPVASERQHSLRLCGLGSVERLGKVCLCHEDSPGWTPSSRKMLRVARAFSSVYEGSIIGNSCTKRRDYHSQALQRAGL
jgi:hypothetical protein